MSAMNSTIRRVPYAGIMNDDFNNNATHVPIYNNIHSMGINASVSRMFCRTTMERMGTVGNTVNLKFLRLRALTVVLYYIHWCVYIMCIINTSVVEIIITIEVIIVKCCW